MYINHLDEPHAMMEQNWSYEKFQILELSDRHGLSILVINICQPIFFWKACIQRTFVLDQNCLRAIKTEFTGHIFSSQGDIIAYRHDLLV
jgi:hypothetical protein